MMELDLDKILKLLKADMNNPSTMKHLGALTDAKYDEVEAIYNLCLGKGIDLSNPTSWVVFGASLDYIQKTIMEYEKIGEIAALVEKPQRINSKGTLERLVKLIEMGEPYKNDYGKYTSLIDNSSKFENKYSLQNEIEPARIPEPVITPATNAASIVETPNAVSPIVETVINNEPTLATEEPSFNHPCEEILSKSITTSLSSEQFESYLTMSDNIRQVLFTLNGSEDVPDEVFVNLQKLVAANVQDAHDLMYYSITYKKNLSDAVLMRLEEKIGECIQDMNYGMGGRAA